MEPALAAIPKPALADVSERRVARGTLPEHGSREIGREEGGYPSEGQSQIWSPFLTVLDPRACLACVPAGADLHEFIDPPRWHPLVAGIAQ